MPQKVRTYKRDRIGRFSRRQYVSKKVPKRPASAAPKKPVSRASASVAVPKDLTAPRTFGKAAPTSYYYDSRTSGIDTWAPKRKYKTVTVEGVKYQIPIDENGSVPEDALLERFANTVEGDREGHERSMARDLNETAVVTHKLGKKITPEEVAEWWAHPNESDLVGIDDETTQDFSADGATRKSSKSYHRKIGVVGTPSERERIHLVLDRNFTAAELKTLTREGYTIKMIGSRDYRELPKDVAGAYYPGTGQIVIRRGAKEGTVIHEHVHRLRHKDTGRTGRYSTSKIDAEHRTGSKYLGAVEEAGTECETIARISPFKANDGRISYYGYTAKTVPEAVKQIREDRKILTGSSDPEKTGLKGRKAVKAVDDNFTKTNISTYSYSGKKARDY